MFHLKLEHLDSILTSIIKTILRASHLKEEKDELNGNVSKIWGVKDDEFISFISKGKETSQWHILEDLDQPYTHRFMHFYKLHFFLVENIEFPLKCVLINLVSKIICVKFHISWKEKRNIFVSYKSVETSHFKTKSKKNNPKQTISVSSQFLS